MSALRLLTELQHLGHPKVLVLGDAILDRYVWGIADRVSQEAPVVLLREETREERPGGAANVAQMVQALEAACTTLVAVVGADRDAEILTGLLEARGITPRVIQDTTRPTTVKERFIGKAHAKHPHQILRVDRESTEPVQGDVEEAIVRAVSEEVAKHDVVLVSDYCKGVCTPAVLEVLLRESHRAGVPVLVDPGRTVPLERYRGATLVKPNRTEAANLLGRPIATIADAREGAELLLQRCDLDYVVLTLDRDGLVLARRGHGTRHFGTEARTVYDITGAGDMVLAALGVCLGSGAPIDAAVQIANVAAGIEVEQVGVVPVGREQIERALRRGRSERSPKIVPLDVLMAEVAKRRARGERIVFTNGCFDLVHAGHVRYLSYAAAQGDCLVVAVNSDASVRRLKGPQRPILGERARAELLAALECVDYVVVFDEDTPHRLLEALKPDVLIKGGTYDIDGVVGREVVLSYGGTVMVGPVVPGISTTAIVERIRAHAGAGRDRKVA